MFIPNLRFFTIVVAILLLTACAELPLQTNQDYQLAKRSSEYQRQYWGFEGRLAITDAQDSWSASITWQHTQQQDQLKLSGFLGQGTTLITVMGDKISIDRGDNKIQESEQIDLFIQQQLGVAIPVQSLPYWLLGVPNPKTAFVEIKQGFLQNTWEIHYLQMLLVNDVWMPRKIIIEQPSTKLKLIIDQWIL